MTSIEWLIEELRQLAHNDKHHLGMGDIRITQGMLDEFHEQAKEMYNKEMVRNTNQLEISDEEALRLAKNMNKQPMTFVPAEISDEDIKRKIKREYWISNNEEKRLMIEGAIWYREQLKNQL